MEQIKVTYGFRFRLVKTVEIVDSETLPHETTSELESIIRDIKTLSLQESVLEHLRNLGWVIVDNQHNKERTERTITYERRNFQ